MQIKILSAGQYNAPKGRDYPVHHHDIWEWVYYLKGSIRCHHNNTSFAGQPGIFWLTPPGVHHAEEATSAYSNIYMGIDCPADARLPLWVADDPKGRIGQICRNAVEEYQSPRADSNHMIEILSQELALAVSRRIGMNFTVRGERIVQQAQWLMEQNFHQKLTISDIAKSCHTSVASLRSHFLQLREVSPKAYLTNLRLTHAQFLLRNTEHTLEVIAGQCGFDSPSHLTRFFKSHFGTSPGKIRRQVQGTSQSDESPYGLIDITR